MPEIFETLPRLPSLLDGVLFLGSIGLQDRGAQMPHAIPAADPERAEQHGQSVPLHNKSVPGWVCGLIGTPIASDYPCTRAILLERCVSGVAPSAFAFELS